MATAAFTIGALSPRATYSRGGHHGAGASSSRRFDTLNEVDTFDEHADGSLVAVSENERLSVTVDPAAGPDVMLETSSYAPVTISNALPGDVAPSQTEEPRSLRATTPTRSGDGPYSDPLELADPADEP